LKKGGGQTLKLRKGKLCKFVVFGDAATGRDNKEAAEGGQNQRQRRKSKKSSNY